MKTSTRSQRESAEQRDQQRVLVVLVDEHHLLRDALDGRRLGGDGHVHGVMDQGAGQGHHLGLHGGREEQRVALGRQLGDDALDVREETHVQHAVGLVEHEDFDRVQAGQALLHQVEQPPRRRHQDVEAAVQRLHLRELADAAEDDGVGEAQVAAVGGGAVVDLRRQFAGRRQDQDARPLGRRRALVQGQVLQDGQDEGRGLAGAGLGAAEQVAAVEQVGDGLDLDGGGDSVALLGHCPLELRQQQRKSTGGRCLPDVSSGGTFRVPAAGSFRAPSSGILKAGMTDVRLLLRVPLAGLFGGSAFFLDFHHISYV